MASAGRWRWSGRCGRRYRAGRCSGRRLDDGGPRRLDRVAAEPDELGRHREQGRAPAAWERPCDARRPGPCPAIRQPWRHGRPRVILRASGKRARETRAGEILRSHDLAGLDRLEAELVPRERLDALGRDRLAEAGLGGACLRLGPLDAPLERLSSRFQSRVSFLTAEQSPAPRHQRERHGKSRQGRQHRPRGAPVQS